MVGIYKITNPNGKIYIGQSVNLNKRKTNYSKLRDCKNQTKLYNSLLKYGFSNHIFEIIEECEVHKLNERERYWQDHYNVVSKGLNLRLTKTEDRTGHCSKETAKKIGDSNRGKKKPPRTCTHRHNLAKALQGNKPTQETRQKLSNIRKQKEGSESWKGGYNPSARRVIDTQTGKVYETIREAAKELNIKPGTLQAWLAGVNKNKSTMRFL